MKTPTLRFSDSYFAFLMNGKITDFKVAADAMTEAAAAGITLESLQTCMDEAHTQAELLCLLVDSPSLQGLE